jgi:hypothetical protein
MMFLEEFGERARECIRLSERAGSAHDRGLFLALARAWYGVDTPNSADSHEPDHKGDILWQEPQIRSLSLTKLNHYRERAAQ